MQSDVGLQDGVERLAAESRGREPELQQCCESQRETSSLDPWLCVIGAIVLALLFLGVVYVAFCL